jgi:hypothetical protein
MQTRRILELAIAVNVLMKPIEGMARIWAHKTLGTTQPGSIAHGVAEIVVVMV